MKWPPMVWPGLVAATLLLATGVRADTTSLKLIPVGAMSKIGYYVPQRLVLSDQKPAGLNKAPADLTAPLYGVLHLGPAENRTDVIVIVDEPDGKDSQLYVDANGNGDLTDDPAPEWNAKPSGPNLKTHLGGATIQLKTAAGPVSIHLGMYRFDKADTRRAAFKMTLFYYRDYAYDGQLTLGDDSYHVMLVDESATGDFRGKQGAPDSGVSLLIDVNKNGRFDPRGEKYDIAKPFNIKGTTYEITNVSPTGGTFEVIKSTKTVAEVLPPPDLTTGSKAISFTTTTSDGKTVKFPDDYKGKIVMLDFWATWCGPCRGELPYVTKAYQTYHDKGFEILGVSLDQMNASAKLASFTQENHMSWPQVYDGKFWQAEIAQLYVIESIPSSFLVDGTTGKIVASGETLRGEQLDKTLSAALASTKK